MSTPTADKYLQFETQERRPGFKTDIIAVSNALNGSQLGTIRWFTPFRKYVFAPEPGTVFDSLCLNFIAMYLSGLMEARKVEGVGHHHL